MDAAYVQVIQSLPSKVKGLDFTVVNFTMHCIAAPASAFSQGPCGSSLDTLTIHEY